MSFALLLVLACRSEDPQDSGGGTGAALAWAPVLEDIEDGAIVSAWSASAADPLWLIGGQPQVGAILVGDADGGFTPMDLPADTPLLTWAHGTGPEDVWVTGVQGTLLHWGPEGWTDHSWPTEAAFWGVYAAGPDQVLAVGGESGWGGDAPIALYLDGATWTELSLPVEIAGISSLFKVRQVDDQWWLIGADGAAAAGPPQALAAVATGTQADLVTLHQHSPGEPVLVVGGRGTGVVLESSGGALSVGSQATAGLNGVQVLADGRAVVVGERGIAGLYDPATDSLVESPAPTSDVLHAAWQHGDQVYAVGGNLYTADAFFHGSVFRAPLPD